MERIEAFKLSDGSIVETEEQAVKLEELIKLKKCLHGLKNKNMHTYIALLNGRLKFKDLFSSYDLQPEYTSHRKCKRLVFNLPDGNKRAGDFVLNDDVCEFQENVIYTSFDSVNKFISYPDLVEVFNDIMTNISELKEIFNNYKP